MNKYNIKELEEKLKRWKNIKLEDITLDDVDDIKDIKVGPTAVECLSRMLENLYR